MNRLPPNKINETQGTQMRVRARDREREGAHLNMNVNGIRKRRIESYTKINDKYYTICIMTSC